MLERIKRNPWIAVGFVVLTWVCMGLAISVEVQQKRAAEEGWSNALDLESKVMDEKGAIDDKYWALVAQDERDADTRKFLSQLIKKDAGHLATNGAAHSYITVTDPQLILAAQSQALSAERLALAAESEARRTAFPEAVPGLIQHRSLLGGHFEQRPSTFLIDAQVTGGLDPEIIPIYGSRTEPVWVPDTGDGR